MTKLKRVAIYTRVSTDGQSVENQRRELLAVAERRGWEVVQEYSDHGISGAKDRDKRPAFDRMLRGATRREFDMIAAWSVDRLGRSLQHLVAFLGEVHGAGVGLYLHQQALDTSTPAGEAMFQMCGVFAQFERSMIVSRVNAGLKRARANGKTLGRPKIAARHRGEHQEGPGEGGQGHLEDRRRVRGGVWNGPADQGGDGDGGRVADPRRQPWRTIWQPHGGRGCVHGRAKRRDVDAQRATCAAWTERRDADRAGQRGA